jgi:hypothetical protein
MTRGLARFACMFGSALANVAGYFEAFFFLLAPVRPFVEAVTDPFVIWRQVNRST